jgi:hypothetical protein
MGIGVEPKVRLRQFAGPNPQADGRPGHLLLGMGKGEFEFAQMSSLNF